VADRPDPRDPRFLAYRGAMWGLFIAVSSVVALVISVSVVRSVWATSPAPLPPSERTLTVKECLDAAEGLWKELDGRRQALSSASPVKSSEPEWYQFRVDWLHRYREAEAHCALDSHSRPALKVVFGKLDDLVDAYTTSAVQYTGQVGSSVDGFRKALAEARADPSAGRF
jgi:hypothetical protein